MRDPNPTTSDLLSQWDAAPRPPAYWPGLGNEHSDGYEIDRDGMKAVSRNLVKFAVSTGSDEYLASYHEHPGYRSLHWRLPQDISRLLYDASSVFSEFWSDLYAETVMAGLLIGRCAQRYDLAEEPLLGDIPMSEFDKRITGMLSGDSPRSSIFSAPGRFYPKGEVSLELFESFDRGVDYMTAEKAKHDFSPEMRFHDRSLDYKQAVDALVELARALQSRAQDLRDSPWRGAAADNAQTALRQIYGSATALAVVAGALAAATSRYAQVSDWCRENFERVVDPDRGGWNEFWDFGATPDSRTRAFLAEPNQEFMTIYDNMPKRIKEDLPGLLITDQTLVEVREGMDRLRPDPPEDGDYGWVLLKEEQERLLKYEEAEKRFG